MKGTRLKYMKLAVLLYGCETWSLMLREEYRLGVFQYKVLRKVFDSKRKKTIGDQRILRTAELNDLYSPPNITMIK